LGIRKAKRVEKPSERGFGRSFGNKGNVFYSDIRGIGRWIEKAIGGESGLSFLIREEIGIGFRFVPEGMENPRPLTEIRKGAPLRGPGQGVSGAIRKNGQEPPS